MGRIGDFFGDWDDFFAFETPKVVLIRDRWLGILSWTLFVAIWVYIIVEPVFLERGYMKKAVPQVHFQFSFRGPCCNGRYNPSNPLAANASICFETCDPSYYAATSALSYCSASTASALTKLNCAYYDPLTLLEDAGEEVTILLRQQTKLYQFAAGCQTNATSALSPGCLPQVLPNAVDNSFVADIESHSMLFNHAVFAGIGGTFSYSTSGQMKGKVVDTQGNIVRRWDDNDGRAGDIMSVAEILQWSNINLDDPAPSAPNNTKRSEGVIILMQLEVIPRVANTDGFKYQYSFTELTGAGYNEYTSLMQGGSARLPVGSVKQRGIRIVIVPIGEFGVFDFPALLVTITSALVLMKFAGVITRTAATMIPRMKYLYRAAMTDVTMDFSDAHDRIKTKHVLSIHKTEPADEKHSYIVSDDLILPITETTLYLWDKKKYRDVYRQASDGVKAKHPDMPHFPHVQHMSDALADYGRVVHKRVHDRHADVAAAMRADGNQAAGALSSTAFATPGAGAGSSTGSAPSKPLVSAASSSFHAAPAAAGGHLEMAIPAHSPSPSAFSHTGPVPQYYYGAGGQQQAQMEGQQQWGHIPPQHAQV